MPIRSSAVSENLKVLRRKNHLPGNLGKYMFFRLLWLFLGVKLMEINSNLFSRWMFVVYHLCFPNVFVISQVTKV